MKVLIISALLFVTPRNSGAEERSQTGDAVLGSVNREMLYAIKKVELRTDRAATGQILRVALKPPASSAPHGRENVRIGLEISDDNQPLRWRIVNDVVWVFADSVVWVDGMRLKLSDLDLFDESDPKHEEKMSQRYAPLFSEHDLNHFFTWQLDKVIRRTVELHAAPELKALGSRERMEKIGREMAFFDFLPTSPNSGRLFLLEENKCKVWSVLGEFEKVFKVREWKLTYSKDPVAVIDLGFTEPFTVFANGDAYFFLTRSCKLYSAAKDADGKWKVEKLWSEANRPIHAVITDTATNKSYAFTQAKAHNDGKKAKDVYFEFDAKLSPVEFDRAKLKSFQLDPPLDTLRSYTQVLIDAKKIDPTPPKKKE